MQQYYPRLARLLAEHPQNKHSVTFAASDWCAPGVFEIAITDNATRNGCGKFLRAAFEYADDPTVDTVVIGSCWACYTSLKDLYGNSAGRLVAGTDQALGNLQRTIARLIANGKRVYVILSIPMGIAFDPHQMVLRTVLPPGFKVKARELSRAEALKTVAPIVARLADTMRLSGAILIDPAASLCDQTTCLSTYSAGAPVYHDWWNLSPEYVRDNVRFLDATVLDAGTDMNPVAARHFPGM